MCSAFINYTYSMSTVYVRLFVYSLFKVIVYVRFTVSGSLYVELTVLDLFRNKRRWREGGKRRVYAVGLNVFF